MLFKLDNYLDSEVQISHRSAMESFCLGHKTKRLGHFNTYKAVIEETVLDVPVH